MAGVKQAALLRFFSVKAPRFTPVKEALFLLFSPRCRAPPFLLRF
jgi:hypothetical protein